MKTKPISRRKFLTAAATAATAVVIVACASGKSAPPAGDESAAMPPLEPGQTVKLMVVYDSVYGNTAQIAEALIAGSAVHPGSQVYKVPEGAPGALEGIDLLLVGSPTHGGTFTEPIKDFLAAIPANGLRGMRAAAFYTSFSKETQTGAAKLAISLLGFAAPKIGEQLSAKGASLVATETFVVLETEGPLQAGEIERAQVWAQGLIGGG